MSSSSRKIIFDVDRVLGFVKSQMTFNRTDGLQGIGMEVDGSLVAGVLYEGYNKHNIWMHVAALPGCRWLSRDFLRVCFRYPFEQLGCSRVTGYVEASNLAARRFDEHLGFKPEAVLSGAASDGGDVLIYAMFKKDCRYVDSI